MKSIRLFFVGTFFVIFFSACCPPQKHVVVEWDKPNTTLKPGQEFRYMIYLDIDDDDTHDDKMPLLKEHIKETRFTLDRHYFIGVEAVLFENGMKVPNVKPSDIAWSNSEEATNEKIFDMQIYK